MSEQQWKLVPVEPTREMCLAARRARSEYPIEEDADSPVVAYRAMLAAAPQPPALGGEPEVMAFLHSSDGYMNERWADLRRDNTCNPRALVLQDHHGAYVARLQAELISANADKAAYAQNAIDLRLQLDESRAEVERLKIGNRTLAELDDQTIRELGGRLKASTARTAGLEGLLREISPIVRRYRMACNASDYPEFVRLDMRIDTELAKSAKS